MQSKDFPLASPNKPFNIKGWWLFKEPWPRRWCPNDMGTLVETAQRGVVEDEEGRCKEVSLNKRLTLRPVLTIRPVFWSCT